MTATVIPFPSPLPPKVIAIIDAGIYWAVEEIVTDRAQRRIDEAQDLLALLAARYEQFDGGRAHINGGRF